MKKVKNLRRLFFPIIAFLLLVPIIQAAPKPSKQMFYEIRIYRVNQPSQAETTEKFLKDAFIPAMHRAGVNTIGVFKPIETDTAYGKFIYVFIPLNNADQYLNIAETLDNDKVYQESGKEFLDAPYNNPPFARYESILLKAFPLMPQFRVPSYTTKPSERIYELRSYESATEAKAAKKIKMFNEGGEIGIFEKVGSNAVFYAKVLMGSQKPRLMYMTTYADMKSHDDHWVAFRSSTEWKTLSGMEEYKNATSKTKPYLLHPTDYSDF
jgi:NIPSNAP.